MGRKQSKPEPKVVVEPVPVVDIPQCFSTSNPKIITILSKRGIFAASCSGNPMIYTYASDRTEHIQKILSEAGL